MLELGFRFVVASFEEMGEGGIGEKGVHHRYPDQAPEQPVGDHHRRIDIDEADQRFDPVVVHYGDHGQQPVQFRQQPGNDGDRGNEVQDDGPRMSGFDGFTLAVAHASETGFAMIGPEGALRFARLSHDDAVVGAGFGAQPAADALVVGKHDLSHENAAHDQIEDRKQGHGPEDQGGPGQLPEIVAGKPDMFAGQQRFEENVQLPAGLVGDGVDVLPPKSPMQVDHVRRHIQTEHAFDSVALEEKNQTGHKGRETGGAWYIHRSQLEAAAGGHANRRHPLSFRHFEQEFYHRPGRHETVGRK